MAKAGRWWTKGFVLSTFESTGHLEMDQLEECKRRIALVKDAGFDLNEITWKTPSTTETILWACMESDMKVLLEDPFANGKMCPPVRERDPESVLLLLKSFEKYRSCIAGVYLYDEPTMDKIGLCAALQKALKKEDLSLLPFFALVPSYGSYTFKNGQYPIYVNEFIRQVDPEVISFDYYCFWQHCIHNPLNRNPLWKDLGFWRQKSIETAKPFWWYFQGINFGPKVPEDESHLIITPAHWAVQMYAGLAYNAKGLSCYNAYGSILDLDGNKTHLYDDVCVLNRKIKKIGQTLYPAKPLGIYHTGLRPAEEKDYFLDAYMGNPYFVSDTGGLIVSMFDRDGKKYALVVSKSFKKGKNVTIRFAGKSFVSTDPDIRPRCSADGTLRFYLPAGTGVLLAEE